jgi:hypothetical protein
MGSLTSLTGGGGLSGGAATATGGDQRTGDSGFGSFNYNAGSQSAVYIALGVAALVALGGMYMLKK